MSSISCGRLVLLLAALALAACSVARTEGAGTSGSTGQQPGSAGWFGGYYDVTLPQGPALQNPAAGKSTTILAFVTADPSPPCAPSWGGTLSLDEADATLQLDTQVKHLRAAGNHIAVSFGGQRGQELATVCPGAEALAGAYRAVINRYELEVVDLDIEGPAAEPAAVQLRAEAMARLQAERPKERPLRVWLTLPVTRDGLDAAGKDNVQAMLAAGVELAGVNIMTMNFGPLGSSESMFNASRRAAEATRQVLEDLYSSAGRPAEAGNMWPMIGLTPMIGDNDVEGNTFSLQDAAALNSFAVEQKLGRMSLWSINRDTGCSSMKEKQPKPSSYCSGIEQDPGDFAKVLGNAFTGSS